jgi:hypothetical protein
MWQIFQRDPLDVIDRRKMRAEKRYNRARRKAYRQLERAESWERFNKRYNEFLAHPFARKKLTSDQREMLYLKKLARQDRKEDRKKWWAKFRRNPWRIIIPRKKKRMDDGGYLYIYHMTKQERRELAIVKRKERRENYRKIISTPDLRQKFILTYLQSTAYFVFTFLLMWVLYQAVTMLVASSFHIPVVWYYYQLKFALSDYSPLYTRSALVTIFAAGPILSLMLGFVLLKLFFSENEKVKRFQLFYLWGFINGANMFFGAYISGFLTRTEFIYTSEWIFLSDVFDIEEIIFVAISIVMLFVIGRIVVPLFLISSGSVTLVKPENRFFFIISQVVLPWLTGVVVLFLITIPNYYIPLIIKTLTPVLALLPALYLYDSLQYENIHRSGAIQHNYFRWSIVIVAIALLFFYRIILSWGLRVI